MNQPPADPDVRSLIQAGYRYAYSLTHHRQDAEDLIQQACLKILRSEVGLKSKSYLFVAVRNLFIDRTRCRSEEQLMDTESAVLVDASRDHVCQIEDHMELEHLLGCLRAEEREALYLNCVEGYTAAEIAELTGQPRGTVTSHMAKAKKRLRNNADKADRVETK